MPAAAAATLLGGLDGRVPREGLRAWFHASGYDAASGVWRDVSGNGYVGVALVGTPSAVRAAGHGAKGEAWQLVGDMHTSMGFGDIVPTAYTVCSVSRYTGTGAACAGRVLQGGSNNWIHGHCLVVGIVIA